jgi:hypothetical protein
MGRRVPPCDLVNITTRQLNAFTKSRSGAIAPQYAGGQAGRDGEFSHSLGGDAPDSRPITTVRRYRARRSASADVGCSRLLLSLGAGRGLRRKLQHGRKLFLREACEQDSMTIRKFNRVVMGAGGLFVDLPENRRGIPHAPARPAEEAAVCDKQSVGKSDFGSRQKANRHFHAFWSSEAPRSGSEVTGDKLVTDRSGAGFYVL